VDGALVIVLVVVAIAGKVRCVVARVRGCRCFNKGMSKAMINIVQQMHAIVASKICGYIVPLNTES
jgi:hypothetical protein